MRTWNYKGTQFGYKTHIQRGGDGDLVIFQTRDGGLPCLPENCVAVRFNEKELLKLLKDKKRFPRIKTKKAKRGKK
ncbi:hypothetical protein [Pseudomonas phage Misse]|uniref:Uncharacterized protein n=1 Tax=Pseudomonas phage Bertil TaxID=2801385 RepID=A0A7T8EQE0_9CAUD|nr:hypothetical protein [Pseudomonas phage Bertil]QQO90844.1 hypothetical protein [Pseudomonas phage Misse]QQO90896.1 hypothetical protein [Pseudomonas phage Strit]